MLLLILIFLVYVPAFSSLGHERTRTEFVSGKFHGTWETQRCSEGACPFGFDFGQKSGIQLLMAGFDEGGVVYSFWHYQIDGDRLIEYGNTREVGRLGLHSLFVRNPEGGTFRASIESVDQLSFEGLDNGGRPFRGVAFRQVVR